MFSKNIMLSVFKNKKQFSIFKLPNVFSCSFVLEKIKLFSKLDTK